MPELIVSAPDRRIRTVDDLKKRLALAASSAPSGWADAVVDIRREYEGHIEAPLRYAAQVRYPVTAHQMPITPFNWAELVATRGSTIYDEPPNRSLVDRNGTVVDDDDSAAKAFADLVKEAQLSVVMPLADQVMYLAGACVLSPRSDTLAGMASGKPAPTVVDILWPNDVMVVVHPQAPTLIQAALEIFVRQTSDAHCQSWVHWMHDVFFDDVGNTIAMGAWHSEIITLRTKRKSSGAFGGASETQEIETRVQWDPYPLPHVPLYVMTKSKPAGFPFVDVNRNLTSLFRTINSSTMSEVHTVDMTAAPILAHTSKHPQPSKVAIGPGVKVNLLDGETLTSITQSADLAGMRATNAALVEALATTQNQPSGAYTGNEGEQSGVALKIKNIPATRQRRRQKEQQRPFEEEQFLPGLVEVHDYFRATSIAARASAYRCEFVDPPDFETPAEKQSRMAEAVALGWIDDARAATESGYYKSVADAQHAIDEERDARMAKTGGALLDANARSKDGVDDLEDDDDEPVKPAV